MDADQLHQQILVTDLHAHPSLNVSLFHRVLTSRIYPSSRAFDPFSVRTNFPQLQAGGVDLMLSVLHAPERGIITECGALNILRYLMPRTWKKIYERPYFEVIQEMYSEIEAAVNSARDASTGAPIGRFAHSVQELDEILNQGSNSPIAFVHCVEGAHALDGSLDNLEALFQRGIAYMILAHFFENEVVHPCYPWPESVQKFGFFQGWRDISLGLKPFGEQVVEKMVELGMLVDVSHSTPPARKRVYEIVGKRAPILASHVGAYEVNPDPYNLEDWEIRQIAEGGGLVSVIFMNFWLMPHETNRGLNFIMRTIDHFVNLAGIEHVSFGSDFDGFTDPPDDLKDASELPHLTERLIAEGYSEDDTTRIMGGNALRVLREGWGRKTGS